MLVSTASLWEIAVKLRIGRLEADIGEISEAIKRQHFSVLNIIGAYLLTLSNLLIHLDHRDPFDHLLIAQAITEGATFVSEDRHTPRYKVKFITCSDRG